MVLHALLLAAQTPASIADGVLLTSQSVAATPAPEQSGIVPVMPSSTPDPIVPAQPDVAPQALPRDRQDIIVKARRHAREDPLETINAKAFAVTEGFDRALLGPAAKAYSHVVPEPVQNGLSNFLSNLREPGIALNFLLQLKPGKAAETLGRLTINSTLGVAGLFDMAKRRPFKLPHRANGFADTMGYYGVKPGPYLFLPLLGPSTPRDLAGFVLDRMILPLAIGRPFNRLAYTIPTSVVNALDRRSAFEEQMQIARASDDPYVARRVFYLKRRQAEIDGLRKKAH